MIHQSDRLEPASPAQTALAGLLRDRTPIAAAVSGSALYGTATSASDDDFRAVFLPSRREILLGDVSFGLDANRTNARLGQGDIDINAVSLMRFLALIGRMDMISCELLFSGANPAFRVMRPTPVFEHILSLRDRLIAGNSSAAIGHARQRLGDFLPASDHSLRTARAAAAVLESCRGTALTDDPERIAELAAIEGVEVVVGRKSPFEPERSWAEMTETERATGRTPGGSIFVLIFGKRIGTASPIADALRTVSRPLSRAEAEKRQRSRGDAIAWKDAYQAVRLLHQAIEIHETRELVFPRPEAPLLRRIRAGEITAPALSEMLDGLMERVRAAEARSPFAAEPCRDAFLEVVETAHLAALRAH